MGWTINSLLGGFYAQDTRAHAQNVPCASPIGALIKKKRRRSGRGLHEATHLLKAYARDEPPSLQITCVTRDHWSWTGSSDSGGEKKKGAIDSKTTALRIPSSRSLNGEGRPEWDSSKGRKDASVVSSSKDNFKKRLI